MDAAHCRANLAIGFSFVVAERYGHLWEAATGAAHHPYWDLVTCVDFLPDWRPAAAGNEPPDEWVGRLIAAV
jgi:hypothetical protein